MFDDDDDSAREVVEAASEVIESESENVKVELYFTKAARVGAMLKMWRKMMLDDSHGSAFPEDWVDHAAMDMFHEFYPPMEGVVDYEHDDDGDE